MLELVPCPLCGGDQHRLLFERPDHTHSVVPEPFKVVRCCRCRFVFVNPRPDPSEILKFYPAEFYEVNVSSNAVLEQKKGTLQARLRLLSHLHPGRLLDVGCAKGEFLEVMRRRGWDVSGVEFSRTPPNLFNLPIHYGTLADAPYAAQSFDLITLWAVLEHMHDPVGLLRRVRALLKQNGRAFILVPNFRSIPGRFMRNDDVPRHLVMFTPRTFNLAAETVGLKPVAWTFSDDIFSGSTRGFLNFCVKLAAGERLDDIVAQNRTPGRWNQFDAFLAGKPNGFITKVDRLDIRIAPYLDRLMNWLRCGFTMTVEVGRTV